MFFIDLIDYSFGFCLVLLLLVMDIGLGIIEDIGGILCLFKHHLIILSNNYAYTNHKFHQNIIFGLDSLIFF